jgi:hypothetical protein
MRGMRPYGVRTNLIPCGNHSGDIFENARFLDAPGAIGNFRRMRSTRGLLLCLYDGKRRPLHGQRPGLCMPRQRQFDLQRALGAVYVRLQSQGRASTELPTPKAVQRSRLAACQLCQLSVPLRDEFQSSEGALIVVACLVRPLRKPHRLRRRPFVRYRLQHVGNAIEAGASLVV